MSRYKESLLRWAGGKYHALSRIIPLINPRKNSCEIFCGSAVITLNLPLLRRSKSEAIVDINSQISNFFRVIRDKPDEYMERMKYTFSGDDWVEELEAQSDDVSRAMCFYLKNRNSFAGFGDFATREGIVYSFGNNPIIKDVTWWAERLRNVRIYRLDFRDALKRVNGLDTDWVLILDPPYPKAGKKGERMYCGETENGKEDLGFTEKDTRDLCKLLHESHHEIFLTYPDKPLIRDLYSDWHIREARWHYHAAPGEKKNTKTELFLSNRPFKKYSVNKVSFDKWSE